MSTNPDPNTSPIDDAVDADSPTPSHLDTWAEAESPTTMGAPEPAPSLSNDLASETWVGADSPYTPQFLHSYVPPPPPRFPNLLDIALVALLLSFGFLCTGALTAAALHFRLFGVSTVQQALTDIHYTLGSQAIWYLSTLAGCALVFPIIWHTGFFQGVEWRARAAFRIRWKLFSAAFACFLLAMVDGLLLPGPKEAPIDQIFRMPGAAWLLFAFGVTLAPFVEELGFRGFLLPALCTAWDWSVERFRHLPPPQRDPEGKVQWSLPAMFAASVLTSVPFALMHGEQTGYSFGPFILLVCVSLVLCWVRLSTRSLAASTLVHASYNLLLFSLMLAASNGFKHLDKM